MTTGALERARVAFEGQAWTDAYEGLIEAQGIEPLGLDDLERLATAAFLTGRHEESEDLWINAHQTALRFGRAPRAARCAFHVAMGLIDRGEMARGAGWLGRANHVLEEARPGLRRTGTAAPAGGTAAPGRGGLRRRACGLRARGRHRVPVRRCGRGDLRRPRPWPRAHQPRIGRRGHGAARRGHGRRHERRDDAHDDRHRVLRGDRGLPASVRPAARPGVDLRAERLVLGAARPRAVPGAVSGAPRRDHAAARSVGRRGRRGAQRAASGCRASRPSASRSTSRPSSSGCAAGSTRRSTCTAGRTSSAIHRSPVSPSSVSHRGRSRSPPPRSGARWTR